MNPVNENQNQGNESSRKGGETADSSGSNYIEAKRCCTVCDAKKTCSICNTQTLIACSDCAIDFGVTVNVCGSRKCRDEHEAKCSHAIRERLREVLELVEQYTRFDFYLWLTMDHSGVKSDPVKRACEAKAILSAIVNGNAATKPLNDFLNPDR